MQYPLCRHIKTNGVQCQSPSMLEELYCFFHTRLYQSHSGFRHTPATRGHLLPGQHIELAPLEDRESVQVALSMVINALATGQLEPRRATALLYGLQLASMNAGNLQLRPFAPSVVRSVQSTPDGLALAQPGATLSVPTRIDNHPEDDSHEQEDSHEQDDSHEQNYSHKQEDSDDPDDAEYPDHQDNACDQDHTSRNPGALPDQESDPTR